MGSNNNNSADIQKGFKMVGDLLKIFDTSSPGTPVDYSGDYREIARMKELEAREQALEEKRIARKTAQDIHSKQERDRSAKTTEWGGSGLAMSGSRKLVQEGRKIEDRQAEDDALFEGEMRARKVVDKGMRDANLFRINMGLEPERSTLSLGSKLYKYGR